ncbi:FkbM family methyltransferase [Benzoatithermus flavus]|uniref:FkbM family methyltransferase n=1 Tax=Benzoatithermus flavus TaxID=3108223 RepID=A0ABU8XM65_9PROT
MRLIEKLRRRLDDVSSPASVRIEEAVVPISPDTPRSLRRALQRGTYEGAERRMLAAVLRPDDTVLELGTGIGLIATLCAKRIGGERVWTFEANPAMAEPIRATFALNGVSPRFEIAFVGDADGTRPFFVNASAPQSSSFTGRPGAERASEVRQVAFRDIMERIRPTVLVVDVEGYEAELFDHAELDGVRAVCIEMHPDIIGDAGCGKVVRRLLAAGFELAIDLCERRGLLFRRAMA